MAYKTTRNPLTNARTLTFYTRPRGTSAHRGMVGKASRRVLRIRAADAMHYHATKGWRGGPCPYFDEPALVA